MSQRRQSGAATAPSGGGSERKKATSTSRGVKVNTAFTSAVQQAQIDERLRALEGIYTNNNAQQQPHPLSSSLPPLDVAQRFPPPGGRGGGGGEYHGHQHQEQGHQQVYPHSNYATPMPHSHPGPGTYYPPHPGSYHYHPDQRLAYAPPPVAPGGTTIPPHHRQPPPGGSYPPPLPSSVHAPLSYHEHHPSVGPPTALHDGGPRRGPPGGGLPPHGRYEEEEEANQLRRIRQLQEELEGMKGTIKNLQKEKVNMEAALKADNSKLSGELRDSYEHSSRQQEKVRLQREEASVNHRHELQELHATIDGKVEAAVKGDRIKQACLRGHIEQGHQEALRGMEATIKQRDATIRGLQLQAENLEQQEQQRRRKGQELQQRRRELQGDGGSSAQRTPTHTSLDGVSIGTKQAARAAVDRYAAQTSGARGAAVGEEYHHHLEEPEAPTAKRQRLETGGGDGAGIHQRHLSHPPQRLMVNVGQSPPPTPSPKTKIKQQQQQRHSNRERNNRRTHNGMSMSSSQPSGSENASQSRSQAMVRQTTTGGRSGDYNLGDNNNHNFLPPSAGQSSLYVREDSSPQPYDPSRGAAVERRFIFTSLDEETKQKLSQAVMMLGQLASVIPSDPDQETLPRSVTHVVVRSACKSVKAFCGLVTGRWIVTPEYIQESLAYGFWLDEEEQNSLRCTPPEPLRFKDVVLRIPDPAMNHGMRVVVEFGGGTVVDDPGEVDTTMLVLTAGDDLLQFCLQSVSHRHSSGE